MLKFLPLLCAIAALIASGHSARANDFDPAEGHYIPAAHSDADSRVTFSFHGGKVTNLKLHGKFGVDFDPRHSNSESISYTRHGFHGRYHLGGVAHYQYFVKWTHRSVVEGRIQIKPDGIFGQTQFISFKSHLQNHGD